MCNRLLPVLFDPAQRSESAAVYRTAATYERSARALLGVLTSTPAGAPCLGSVDPFDVCDMAEPKHTFASANRKTVGNSSSFYTILN